MYDVFLTRRESDDSKGQEILRDATRGKMKDDRVPLPRWPAHVPEYAKFTLLTLAASGLGEKISLGGALGLLHYLDYRPTHDVDAWWVSSATAEDQRQVIDTIEAALQPYGQVRQRTWGDVVSVELVREDKTVFSFQIARRSAQLVPSTPAPWGEVLLDSFPDLLASKMVALVERGAPRDFRDVYALCQAGLTTPQECWELWRRRQQLANSDTDSARARLAVETHLARIAQHRPLREITDPTQRAQAEQVRRWFVQEFLDALTE